mmetsp:Transcript_362/g.631  ORF Transcript_362/g.631 Transcript_362/m.631 type:complete len:111 (-) Transcript_362:265-597(-)|eukprot:CAMPEP_0177757418 /NCGR_PEP_ID=MMETSP0491_2-20121128/3630_1 /TAXON_ID=63592 /ORGANISM="Tetraselmis chuii, Strain PLY429" /LENGTH=110 /DNA_ID=CAMNT_0019273063 /DNA_START=125 /DNA_END=457 /DNA_ORIENTATION=+
MESLQEYYALVSHDFATAWNILTESWRAGAVPPVADLPTTSLIAGALLINVLALMLTAKGRRFLWDCFETVVASVIVVALLLALIVLPAGALYGVFKLLSMAFLTGAPTL